MFFDGTLHIIPAYWLIDIKLPAHHKQDNHIPTTRTDLSWSRLLELGMRLASEALLKLSWASYIAVFLLSARVVKGIFRYIYYKIGGGRNSKSINIAAVQVFFTWFLSSSEMWLRQVKGRKASVSGNTQALIIRRRPRFVESHQAGIGDING